MAPHTRQSQTKGTAVSTMGNENEHPIPFQTSNLANVSTSMQSRVPARRVIPGNPNQSQHVGKSSLNLQSETVIRLAIKSTRETHLCPSCPIPK